MNHASSRWHKLLTINISSVITLMLQPPQAALTRITPAAITTIAPMTVSDPLGLAPALRCSLLSLQEATVLRILLVLAEARELTSPG